MLPHAVSRGASVALLGSLLLLSGGCGGRRSAVVIAAVGDWTGPDDRALRQGIELAAAEVNGAGGVDGRPLEIRFREDRNDNAAAAQVARELVADPAVIAVIGHTRSDPTLVAVKVYDGKMPVVTARFGSPDLTGLSRWLFQIVPTDSAYSAAVARFAGERGWKRAAVVFNNSARGRETAEQFQKQFRGEVVSLDPATFPAPLPGDMKIMVEYHRLVAPDVVFAPVGEPKEYIPEAQRQGLAAPVIGWDVWSSLTSDPSLPGTFYQVVPFDLGAERAETRHFVDAWRGRNAGAEPTPFAALGYDAVRLLSAVAGDAGAGRRQVRDALAALQPAHPFAGAIGPIAFDPAQGTVIGPEPTIRRLRQAAPAANDAAGGAR